MRIIWADCVQLGLDSGGLVGRLGRRGDPATSRGKGGDVPAGVRGVPALPRRRRRADFARGGARVSAQAEKARPLRSSPLLKFWALPLKSGSPSHPAPFSLNSGHSAAASSGRERPTPGPCGPRRAFAGCAAPPADRPRVPVRRTGCRGPRRQQVQGAQGSRPAWTNSSCATCERHSIHRWRTPHPHPHSPRLLICREDRKQLMLRSLAVPYPHCQPLHTSSGAQVAPHLPLRSRLCRTPSPSPKPHLHNLECHLPGSGLPRRQSDNATHKKGSL